MTTAVFLVFQHALTARRLDCNPLLTPSNPDVCDILEELGVSVPDPTLDFIFEQVSY